jgi:hypothetical protein
MPWRRFAPLPTQFPAIQLSLFNALETIKLPECDSLFWRSGKLFPNFQRPSVSLPEYLEEITAPPTIAGAK